MYGKRNKVEMNENKKKGLERIEKREKKDKNRKINGWRKREMEKSEWKKKKKIIIQLNVDIKSGKERFNKQRKIKRLERERKKEKMKIMKKWDKGKKRDRK